ncbi:glycosyltransferase family 4 protein [Clostridium omnivorum]|uniref:Glycosyl transferase family 1 domain-containing protein n=1 Tax=Clostridium omnivorum TaxID=1604902 RepID=A0ABQ5N3C6_9CLOT|nr:glycosyltransferase family 1 protein [Clostridium sp. E14]GLC29712.1 hypothetical protein bsdE14_11220 [Clostridium sp. E14]
MKILIDLTSLADNFSGIERFAMCISKEIINCKDNEYVLIFKNEIHNEFEELVDNVRVKAYVLKGRNKLLFNQVILPLKIYGIKADAYLFLAFPVPILLFKTNMISTIHDICCWDCPETMKSVSKWYFRISHKVAIRKCKSIITISEFSKQRIVERLKYPENKIWKIKCGISDVFLDFSFSSEENEKVISKYKLPSNYLLCLSTLEPRKNMRLLVEAYSRLVLECNVNQDLVLAGRKGWKIDDLLASLDKKVASKIHVTGFIDDIDLPYIYKNAQSFIFPSKYEGFGIPPLEAMSVGTAVISSDSTSLPEVLGNAAIYFENNNKNDLERKIYYITSLITQNEYLELKKDGINRVKLFSWEKEAKKLIEKLKL